MDKGYLEIFIFGARELFPIEFAEIYIKKDGELINHLTTDESGRGERLEFETPPESESTSPGFDKPFTTINVTILKEGFFPTTIENVQIFPNIVSRLNTELVPIPDNPEFTGMDLNYTSNAQRL